VWAPRPDAMAVHKTPPCAAPAGIGTIQLPLQLSWYSSGITARADDGIRGEPDHQECTRRPRSIPWPLVHSRRLGSHLPRLLVPRPGCCCSPPPSTGRARLLPAAHFGPRGNAWFTRPAFFCPVNLLKFERKRAARPAASSCRQGVRVRCGVRGFILGRCSSVVPRPGLVQSENIERPSESGTNKRSHKILSSEDAAGEWIRMDEPLKRSPCRRRPASHVPSCWTVVVQSDARIHLARGRRQLSAEGLFLLRALPNQGPGRIRENASAREGRVDADLETCRYPLIFRVLPVVPGRRSGDSRVCPNKLCALGEQVELRR
jgi:hypothetical protein